MTVTTRHALAAGLDLVPSRQLIVDVVDAWFPLAPGDRALVGDGDVVEPGMPLAERSAGAQTMIVRTAAAEAASLHPGDRWPPVEDGGSPAASRHDGERPGEVLFAVGGRWRVAVPNRLEIVDAPVNGTVTAVDPGSGIRIRVVGRAVLGRSLLGDSVRGPLEVAAPAHAELRASAIDVGRAGAVIVGGAHADAEAITRARATGVRGIIVASLGSSVRRDLVASEGRRRAALHGQAPFGILILYGALRRPIASAHATILKALEGREVSLLSDPPAFVIDDASVVLPEPAADSVRIVGGPLSGREGRWFDVAPRRMRGAADTLAGIIDLGRDGRHSIPIGDLERFA